MGSLVLGPGLLLSALSDLVFGPVPFSFVLVQSIVLFPESTRGFAPFPESIWALPLLFS